MSREGRLLEPSLVSTIELLAEPGACFYIPAYQRNFGWLDENIERLLEDIVRGIEGMVPSDSGVEDSLAETFLGTVVCFDEKIGPHSSVFPRVVNDQPTRIYVLIDGQQRLTVCLTTAIVLHNFLASNSKIPPDINDDEVTEQFNDLKEAIKGDLYKMLAEHGLSTGDRPYYPRMIRALDDCWSKERAKSQYVQPIGALLAEYIDHVRQNKVRFDFSSNASKDVRANIINDYVEYLSETKHVEDEEDESNKYSFAPLPDITKLFDSESVQRELFDRSGITLFSTLKTKIADFSKKEQSKLEKALLAYEKMARAMTISSYLLKRVKFIRMVTTSKTYASSIFDSLNTTGDQLTAFETFAPEVVQSFNSSEEYANSPVRKMITEIDGYLNVLNNVDARDQASKTAELIVSFALAENGEKLTKELRVQRKDMLKWYRKQKDKEHGIDYICNLLHVARVNEEFYTEHPKRSKLSNCLAGFLSETEKLWGNDDPEHTRLAGEAIFCLRFLIASWHRIVIPLIARFYTRFENSKDIAAHKDLCKVIRSTAAFFVLWRSSRMSTDNIDNHHRKIMYHRYYEPPLLDFARNPDCGEDEPGEPDLARLQNEYCRLLVDHPQWEIADDPVNKNQTLSKEKWIELSAKTPIYGTQTHVAKFVLLLSSYWKTSNQAGAAGIIDANLWHHPAHETVEHIMPQSSASSSEEKELIHSFGNLTLLPGKVNSSIKDAGWERCKLIYATLGMDHKKLNAKLLELKLSEKEEAQAKKDHQAFEDLYNGPYIPTLKLIAEHKDFDFETIRARSSEVLASAWEPLIEWLGGPPAIAPEVTLTVADQSLVVSWEAVELAEEYVVVVDPAADSGSPITVPADIPATRQTVTVSGLVNGTEYTISVMARNNFGEGPQSVQKQAVPAEVAAKR